MNEEDRAGLRSVRNKALRLYNGFFKSEFFAKLLPIQSEYSKQIILGFAEYMYSYELLPPRDWGCEPGSAEGICESLLPLEFDRETVVVKSIFPVLTTFFEFINSRKLLPNSDALVERFRQKTVF